MKRQGLLLLLLLAVSTLPAQIFRVGTFNIRYQNTQDEKQGNGWKKRLPLVIKDIALSRAEIIGMQEVLDSQLADLKDSLPAFDAIGVGRDDGKDKGEFTPLFYKREKFELLKSGTFWLSPTDSLPSVGWDAALPRICTWAYFRIKDGGARLWVFNVHLDHVGNQARTESLRLVRSKMKAWCGRDLVVLTDDFNAGQRSEVYKEVLSDGKLADAYEAGQERCASVNTFNDFNPALKTDERIDHLFVDPRLEVMDYKIIVNPVLERRTEKGAKAGEDPYVIRYSSDHFTVVAKLSFNGTY